MPLAPYQVTRHDKGRLPEKAGFLSVRPDHLILSSFKMAEDRETCILRVFNPTSQMIEGELEAGGQIKEAWLVNLNEERATELPMIDDCKVLIEAAPGKIVTLELFFA